MKPTPSYYPILAATDPGVHINWDFFPFMPTLRDAVGGVMATTLVIAVALLIIAAITWAIGRSAGSKAVQTGSAIGILAVVVTAVLIGAANGIIGWGGGIDTGF